MKGCLHLLQNRFPGWIHEKWRQGKQCGSRIPVPPFLRLYLKHQTSGPKSWGPPPLNRLANPGACCLIVRSRSQRFLPLSSSSNSSTKVSGNIVILKPSKPSQTSTSGAWTAASWQIALVPLPLVSFGIHMQRGMVESKKQDLALTHKFHKCHSSLSMSNCCAPAMVKESEVFHCSRADNYLYIFTCFCYLDCIVSIWFNIFDIFYMWSYDFVIWHWCVLINKCKQHGAVQSQAKWGASGHWRLWCLLFGCAFTQASARSVGVCRCM